MIPEITIVIRSSGERTLALCHHLIEMQVPSENIIVITESPFSQAVKHTFELGMERDLPWTLAIDADVLVVDGAIAKLLEIARQKDSNVFEVQGQILDKLFGGPRPGGPHLFRTSFLEEALPLIPDEGVSMRPETFLIKQMASNGNPWIQEEVVLGLHDYEQYFSDIYRKAFMHVRKHGRHIPYLENLWRRLAEKDADYQVAMWGFRASQIYDEGVNIDVKCFPEEIQPLLRMRNWKEKGDLSPTALTASKIEHFIDTFTSPPEYLDIKHLMAVLNGDSLPCDWRVKLNAILKKTGLTRMIPWLFGWGLERIGRTLRTWAEK